MRKQLPPELEAFIAENPPPKTTFSWEGKKYEVLGTDYSATLARIILPDLTVLCAEFGSFQNSINGYQVWFVERNGVQEDAELTNILRQLGVTDTEKAADILNAVVATEIFLG